MSNSLLNPVEARAELTCLPLKKEIRSHKHGSISEENANKDTLNQENGGISQFVGFLTFLRNSF